VHFDYIGRANAQLTIRLKVLPQNSRDEALLSRLDLTRRWNCHVETLKRWEGQGRLKPIKIGGKFLRYRLSDIEKLEEENQK
jgi:hypothetical protein